MPTIKTVKRLLRVDGSEDTPVLAFHIEAAKEYLKNAGVPEPTEPSKQYDLAVTAYVSLQYDDLDKNQREKLEKSLTGIILQRKTGI